MRNRTDENPQPSGMPAVPRRVMLRLFLDERGLNNADLAKRFDVSLPMISRVLNAKEAPRKYVEGLRDEFGVPEALLPVATDKKPGPQPKSASAAA